MKKFIFSMIIMLSALVSSHAQQTTVEGTGLFNNTTVSVYGGAMGWINPAVTNSETFLEGVRPSAGLALGKWFTPAVGAEIFYETSANSFPFNENLKRWTVADFMNLGLNGQVNVNNLVHRYKGQPDRVEFIPYVGMGWGHGFTNTPGSYLSAPDFNRGDHTSNYMTANMGTRVDFNMGKQRAWQINIRPSISYMLAGEGLLVRFDAQRAYVGLQAGVTYKFGHKTSTGEKTHNFTKAYTVAEYNDLLNKYNELDAAYQQKPKEVEKIVEKIVEKEVPVEVVKTVNTLPAPHFVRNLALVDATSVAELDSLAAEIKSTGDNYVLTGYASTEGETDYNNALSLKRAEAIKQCLVDRGVDASRLSTVAGGETEKFGDTYEANRVVTIEKQ